MGRIALLFILLSMGCTDQTKQVSEPPAKAAPTAPVISATVPTAPPPAVKSLKRSCSKGTDKRELEVVVKGDGCVLNYTQAGKVKEKTASPHGSKRCETSESKLIAKLEKTGFQCN